MNREEKEEDIQSLKELIDLGKDYINNQPLELTFEEENDSIETVFNDINKYTSFVIANSYSGNNKLYHSYIKLFLRKSTTQQIFNSPKVLIYAQVPNKLQGVMYTFNKGKYKKAVKHLFDLNAQRTIHL